MTRSAAKPSNFNVQVVFNAQGNMVVRLCQGISQTSHKTKGKNMKMMKFNRQSPLTNEKLTKSTTDTSIAIIH